jgi:rare lipoprotein A
MSPKIWLFLPVLMAAVPARAETIVASWYGPGFHGKPTASGCIYNMYGMTAASRTLPLGTVLEVRYDGATVRVVVNDRGPYIHGRDLDLSRGAAARLGMVDIGVAPVHVRIVGVSPPCPLRGFRTARAETG